jgi:DNA invertase Pin-like site-specific DNA recombinase
MVKELQMLPDGEYWIYLRKSRADLEAEARGEGETLAKHRKALYKLAKDRSLNITSIFEEVVSGEFLIDRPEAMEMLRLMPIANPKGILVMDIDRLGRGDQIDQGTIQRAFKETKTLIVTPMKVYDLEDEFDEEYTEFGMFMARKELKMINRRLQRGRISSVEQGNYIGTRPPYGFEIHKNDRGDRYLVPHPEQANVVRLIFEWYAAGSEGTNKIANRLNEMGVRSYDDKQWKASSVLNIIKNAVYTGLIQWKKVESKKSKEPGKRRDSKMRPIADWISVKGKHEPLISEELFKQCQDHLKTKYHSPYQLNGLSNPLAGIIRCEMCSSAMVMRPYTNQPPHIMCYNKFCTNRSSRFEYVEQYLLTALEKLLISYKTQWGKSKPKQTNNAIEIKTSIIAQLEKDQVDLAAQKNSLHDYLERKIYSEETFLERSRNLAERLEANLNHIERAKSELYQELSKEKAQNNVIPKIQEVLKKYPKFKTVEEKNKALKSVLLYATYQKEKHQRNAEFSLTLYPKLPR